MSEVTPLEAPETTTDSQTPASQTPTGQTTQAEPARDPTPLFRNPIMDRMFRRGKLQKEIVTINVDGEDFVFEVHEMSVAMKGRFEGMMAAAAANANDDPASDEPSNPEEVVIDERDLAVIKCKVISACVTTPDGQPIVMDDEWRTVLDMPNRVVEPLFKAAFQLAGLGNLQNAKKAEADSEND